MTDLKEGNSLFIQLASADYDVDKVSFRGRNRCFFSKSCFFLFVFVVLLQQITLLIISLQTLFLISTHLYDGRIFLLQDVVK